MIKVLHIFNHYLPKTENWAYQLISNTPECEQHIASKVYLNTLPGQGVFRFMDNPLSELESEDQQTDWKKNIFKKAYIRASKQFTKSFDSQLEEYIIENKIDIVHAHFANMGWEVQETVKKLKLPLVVSFYGWDYEMLPHVKPEWKSRFIDMFAKVDMILTEGEHGKETLVSKGSTAEKIKVQKLGIEKSLIISITRDKQKDDLNLIQIASFTEKKGQLYTVKAFGKSLSVCPNMHLTLIGDNREEAYQKEVLDYVKANKLQEKITIKDFIPYAELESQLSKHHVFIHPSCYAANMNCEGGAPTIIFNAAGSGMPTIGTTHCDIPSLVVDGKTGVLSAEKSVDDLAKSISTFYKMGSEDYNVYAKASHEHIAKNYCIEENAKKLSDYYNMLTNKTA